MLSVTATHLHPGGAKAAVDSREINDWPCGKLFIKVINGKDHILCVIPFI